MTNRENKMFSDTELDTILDALHDQRDECEHALDVLLDRGLNVLDPRRVAVQVRMTKIENLIIKIHGMGRA